MAIEEHPLVREESRPVIDVPVGGPADVTGARPRWVPPAICGVLYALSTLVLFGHLGSLGSAHMTGPQTVDQVIQVWWLAWDEFAIFHGHNLFFTNWQNFPVGINAGVNGSVIALGVAISPITKLFGPVVAWNVVLRVAVFASALSMCLVLRRWVRWWPAAFAGGLLYGFSTYVTTYGDRDVFMSCVPLPPLLFLIVYEIMFRQRWRPRRAGVALAVVGAVQFLISTEVFASAIVLALLGSGLYVAANRADIGAQWPYIRRAMGSCSIAGAVLLVVPLYFTLLGPQAIDGAPNAPGNLAKLHGDLLGLVVPGYLQRFGTAELTSFSLQHLLNSTDMYVGLPFLVAVVVTIVLLRDRGIVVMAGVLTGCSMVLSLGAYLYVGGVDTHVPLPFLILAHLPLTDGMLSTRLALYTALFGAGILAIGLDALHHRIIEGRRRERIPSLGRRGLAVAATVALFLVVALPILPADAEQLSATGTPSSSLVNALHGIPAGSVVLAYPYPGSPIVPDPFSYKYESMDDALLDQAVTGLPFKLIGSYGWRPSDSSGGTPGPSVLSPRSVPALFASSFDGFATPAQAALMAHADLSADLRSFMRQHQVGTVVALPLGQDPQRVVREVTKAIGPPSRTDGWTIWYHVQQRINSGAS